MAESKEILMQLQNIEEAERFADQEIARGLNLISEGQTIIDAANKLFADCSAKKNQLTNQLIEIINPAEQLVSSGDSSRKLITSSDLILKQAPIILSPFSSSLIQNTSTHDSKSGENVACNLGPEKPEDRKKKKEKLDMLNPAKRLNRLQDLFSAEDKPLKGGHRYSLKSENFGKQRKVFQTVFKEVFSLDFSKQKIVPDFNGNYPKVMTYQGVPPDIVKLMFVAGLIKTCYVSRDSLQEIADLPPEIRSAVKKYKDSFPGGDLFINFTSCIPEWEEEPIPILYFSRHVCQVGRIPEKGAGRDKVLKTLKTIQWCDSYQDKEWRSHIRAKGLADQYQLLDKLQRKKIWILAHKEGIFIYANSNRITPSDSQKLRDEIYGIKMNEVDSTPLTQQKLCQLMRHKEEKRTCRWCKSNQTADKEKEKGAESLFSGLEGAELLNISLGMESSSSGDKI